MTEIAAVIMHAPLGNSAGEILVENAREASAIDLATVLHEAGVDRIILVAQGDGLSGRIAESGVRVETQRGSHPFHFGRTLQGIIDRYSLDGLLYFGSGSGGLLDIDRARTLFQFAKRNRMSAAFNNFYSCDYVAVSRAQGLLSMDLPEIDNPLGLSLSDQGMDCYSLPRELETQFDIDTPTDVLLLAASGLGGEEMRRFSRGIDYDERRISGVMSLLHRRDAQVMIIGRVNPITWANFEQEAACRTSVISEGRGMKSYPSSKTTFIGLEREKGTGYFFKRLAQACDGAIIDTRPMLAQGGHLPPASDRFASDLLDHASITDPVWREFTLAASQAEIPVILGGHSLVSGGLYLLSRAGWKDHDLRRRLHPDTIDWQKERT